MEEKLAGKMGRIGKVFPSGGAAQIIQMAREAEDAKIEIYKLLMTGYGYEPREAMAGAEQAFRRAVKMAETGTMTVTEILSRIRQRAVDKLNEERDPGAWTYSPPWSDHKCPGCGMSVDQEGAFCPVCTKEPERRRKP